MRDLALHVLDIARNAIDAGATRIELAITEDRRADTLELVVRDNGAGMDDEMLGWVLDPFFTTRDTRKVGLGLPLLQATCTRCEGDLQIDSQPGVGTCIHATMRLGSIDRPPLGDIGGVLQALACEAQTVCVRYAHQTNGGCFAVDTDQLQQELGDVPLAEPAVLRWLRQYTNEQVETLTVAG